MKKLPEFIRVILTAICIVFFLGTIFLLDSYQGEGLPRPWNWVAAGIASAAGYLFVRRIYKTSAKPKKTSE